MKDSENLGNFNLEKFVLTRHDFVKSLFALRTKTLNPISSAVNP